MRALPCLLSALLVACAPGAYRWGSPLGPTPPTGGSLVLAQDDVPGTCARGCVYDENGELDCTHPCDEEPVTTTHEETEEEHERHAARHVGNGPIIVAAVLLCGVTLFMAVDIGWGVMTGHPPVTF